MKQLTIEQVKTFQARVKNINISKTPAFRLDRCAPRKERAREARKLFKHLGLNNISVTTPNYSMAQSVQISLPQRQDRELNEHGIIVVSCEASRANRATADKIEAILSKAFPNHDDRSNSMTDYYNYCWSFS